MAKTFYGVAGLEGLATGSNYLVDVWDSMEDYVDQKPQVACVRIVLEPGSNSSTADLLASRIAWLLRRDSTET